MQHQQKHQYDPSSEFQLLSGLLRQFIQGTGVRNIKEPQKRKGPVAAGAQICQTNAEDERHGNIRIIHHHFHLLRGQQLFTFQAT